jgi:hypothetical protein
MIIRHIHLVILTGLTWLSLAGQARAAQHRFAVFVGNDQGGKDTRPLVYAAEDARKLHAVFTQIGGVRPADALLVLNQPIGNLLSALSTLEIRIHESKARGEETLLVVYFSGHAKDGELRLGETRFSLEAWKSRLANSPADVRMGILDSCRSGLVNRTKGARKAPAFSIETSDQAKGLVLLTSASANEDAQESDELRGSYFSHYLQTGLRGDADQSRDRRITLSEAYAYAYARTVADTVDSAAGAQHPTFSYDFKGNSELVLADLTNQHEGLYLPTHAPAGIYYIVDARGFIAAEIHKSEGIDRQLALASGRYHIRRRLSDRLRIGEIQIVPGQVSLLHESQLHDAPFSDDPIKGPTAALKTRFSLGVGGTFQAFFDGPVRADLFPATGLLSVEFKVRNFFRHGWVWGLDLGSGSTRGDLYRYGNTLPFKFSEFTAGSSFGPEWSFWDDLISPFLGVRMAVILMNRRFDDAGIPEQFFATFTPGIVTGIRARIGGGFALQTRARLQYLLYTVEENRSLGYWELATEVVYDF